MYSLLLYRVGACFLTIVCFLGSLPQRPWKQRPRSSPTPMYQSSLDRYVPCVCTHTHISTASTIRASLSSLSWLTLRGHDIVSRVWLFQLHCTTITQPPPPLSLPSDCPVGFVTGTATAVGLVGAPSTISLLRHRADLTVPPYPSASPRSASAIGRLRYVQGFFCFVGSEKWMQEKYFSENIKRYVVCVPMLQLWSIYCEWWDTFTEQQSLFCVFVLSGVGSRIRQNVRRTTNCSWASGIHRGKFICCLFISSPFRLTSLWIPVVVLFLRCLNSVFSCTSNYLCAELHEQYLYIHVCECVCACPPQSRKGRSCSSQREVTVVLPSGQYVVVRCDIKSKARDVFDMVVAHANLVEHFYFGLAFIDGKILYGSYSGLVI